MAKRGWLIAVASVAAIFATSWFAKPGPCDYGIDGQLEHRVWVSNLWQRLNGRPQNCDPWVHVAAEAALGPIILMHSINACAGPSSHILMIWPDGRVKTFPNADWLNPTSDSEYAYSFYDPAIYALANRLLSPLARYSDPTPPLLMVSGKSILPCDSDFYHQGFLVTWSGSLEASRDVSSFKHDDACPAVSAAYDRLYRVKEAVDARTPAEVWERRATLRDTESSRVH